MDSRIKKRAVLISAIMVLLVVFVTFLGNMSRMKSLFGKDQSEEEQTEQETPSEIESLVQETDEGTETEDDGSFAQDGFAGADKTKQVGDDLRAFLRDSTFFDRELSSYEKKLLEANEKSLSFVTTSVERDLRVQILDGAGNVVTGVPFVVSLKEQGSYIDQDKDGIVYISNLSAGDYEVTLTEAGEFEKPKPTVVSVRD